MQGESGGVQSTTSPRETSSALATKSPGLGALRRRGRPWSEHRVGVDEGQAQAARGERDRRAVGCRDGRTGDGRIRREPDTTSTPERSAASVPTAPLGDARSGRGNSVAMRD
jgi:hypothetical protein